MVRLGGNISTALTSYQSLRSGGFKVQTFFLACPCGVQRSREIDRCYFGLECS